MPNKNNTKYYLKIKSKIHPDIYHTEFIDLRCYEKMPAENKLNRERNKNTTKKTGNVNVLSG